MVVDSKRSTPRKWRLWTVFGAFLGFKASARLRIFGSIMLCVSGVNPDPSSAL